MDMDTVPVDDPPPSPPPLPPHPKVTANKISVPNAIKLLVIFISTSLVVLALFQIRVGILSQLQIKAIENISNKYTGIVGLMFYKGWRG
jgi:hypothetical protein